MPSKNKPPPYHWVGEVTVAPELKPCPFCGSPARFSLYGKDNKEFTIGCGGEQVQYAPEGTVSTDCPAWNHRVEDNRYGAVARAAERWNRRTTSTRTTDK